LTVSRLRLRPWWIKFSTRIANSWPNPEVERFNWKAFFPGGPIHRQAAKKLLV
jgi:hypothetical protein